MRPPLTRSSTISTKPEIGPTVTRPSTGVSTHRSRQTPALKPQNSAVNPSATAKPIGRPRARTATPAAIAAAASGAHKAGRPSAAK